MSLVTSARRIDEVLTKRMGMPKTIVFEDYSLIGCIVSFLHSEGCLAFVLCCRRFRSCYRDYLRRPLQSDHNCYCSSLSQIEWAKSLPRSPINESTLATKSEADKLICLGTVASGDIKIFRDAFKECTGEVDLYHADHKVIYSSFRDELLKVAARYGRLDMLEHLRQSGIWLSPPPPSVITAAASSGQRKVVQYLFSLSPPCVPNSKVLYEVAGSGQLDMLLLLRSKNKSCQWLHSTTMHAALGGHLKVLQWMATLTVPPLPAWRAELVSKIVRYPELNHVLVWVLAQPHIVVIETAAASAIAGNNLKGLQALRQRSPPCPLSCTKLADIAIAVDNIEILEYLKCEGYFELHTHQRRRYCNAAAKVGLPVMQWLRAQTPPCPWFSSTLAAAAECGNLEVLSWSRAQGCEWGSNVCLKAAVGGQIETLRWLRSRNPCPCPWTAECCDQASITGNIKMLEYLRVEASPPCPWNIDQTVFFAFDLYNINMFKWLHQQQQRKHSAEIASAISKNIRIFLQSPQQYDIRAEGYALKKRFKVVLQLLGEKKLLSHPFNEPEFIAMLNSSGGGISIAFAEWVKENVPNLNEKLSRWVYF